MHLLLILLFKFLKERESFQEQEKKTHLNPVINFTSHLQNVFYMQMNSLKLNNFFLWFTYPIN